MSSKILIIGISGVTCGGKTTLAYKLNKMFPTSKLISQDDYFLDVDDPRHTWITELNHINFDILSSLDMEKMEK
jgi:nicotinamide/nicotinate riboside kinase